MTMTADKRQSRPAFYACKDARTAIYRVLFGYPDKRDKDCPESNPHRRFLDSWSFQHAKSIFTANIEAAAFPLARRKFLEQRLDQLKNFKPTSG